MGGLQSAETVIYSLNFGNVQQGGWLESFELLLNACKELENKKVYDIALGSNIEYLFADKIQKQISTSIINIITVTAKNIRTKGITKVGLLGTKFTMEMGFIRLH
ncbi:hypothetical protein [Mesonia maritima]|uniref:Aspartate/glutamate racemase n=1 Tax=Mesonia maritima TaxID=1793873 RepID=A0ABU1K5R6_9FLAO|nr:hypothetical protein [Mesonia maritima]MDR6300959.1 aspartate/glutamate racemase [Mesonia maritima]